MRRVKGFTLIELLIVVAIIAILAAIAVPNFLEAQVRSKAGRAKADMRSIAVGLEAYNVEYNRYPPDHTTINAFDSSTVPGLILYSLTTPVAYITSVPKSAFIHKDSRTVQPKDTPKGAFPDEYFYVGRDWVELTLGLDDFDGVDDFQDKGKKWGLVCWGPDRIWNAGEYLMFGEDVVNTRKPMNEPNIWGVAPVGGAIYDATNGTTSYGDIVRVGP